MDCCFCAPSFPVVKARSAKPAVSRRRLRMRTGDKPSEAESFTKDLQVLLCGDLGSSGRQILAQDLAKRAPSAVDDALRSRGLGGVVDFARQLREDILPDVFTNGPAYVANAREAVSRRPTVPTPSSSSQIPRFDPETVQQELRNVFNRTPEGVETPDFAVLARRDGYEVRRYGRMIVARTDMRVDPALRVDEKVGMTEVENAGAMGASFSTLAAYLFGENEKSAEMKMTTPVILDKRDDGEEAMSFIIGEYDEVEDVPKPSGKVAKSVELEELEGVMYAAVEFSGFATVGEMRRQREMLLEMLAKDGVEMAPDAGSAYKCVIYNGPTTLPIFRRNELLIPVLSLGVTETETVEDDAEQAADKEN